MSHQTLTVKLCELEKQMARMQNSIRLSDSASLPKIHAEIESLQKEYAENELTLQNKMRHSKTEVTAVLSSAFGKIEPIIRDTQAALRAETQEYENREISNEYKLLLAEYELDFSMLVIGRALLVSLDAIASQLETLQGGMEA